MVMHPYVTIGASPVEPSFAFYDAVLGAIGWSSHASFGGGRGYSKGGTGDGFLAWIVKPFDGSPASAGNGAMVAFPAASRAQVEAFHAAGMAQGGTDEGAPGLRPQYGPDWYAAYLRDPFGNKIAVVFNG